MGRCAVDCLRVSYARMDARREHVVVKRAFWLVRVRLVLWLAVTELLYQFLPVVQISDFLVLFNDFSMIHLSSLNFCDRMLPGLLNVFGIVSSERCPEATVAHLLIIDVILSSELLLLVA